MHRPLTSPPASKFFAFPNFLRSSFVAIFIVAGLALPILPVFAASDAITDADCGDDERATADGTGCEKISADVSCPVGQHAEGSGCVADAPAAAADAPTTTAETTKAEAETVGQSLDHPGAVASFFADIADMVARLLGILIIAVLDITIPIMRYQGFVGSPVVIAGWAIVRDVVNMFFVVVLIVIAMGTIFGSSKFTWRQQVPKLMLFAILINFSKTLCGLMIDFAQVIMLTFANALKDIAGGNFIQLLGLGKMMSLSPGAPAVAVGIGSWELFAASAAAVIMMVWVLAIVIMLLFILVYRVVMLWILIVMAPLAWFTAAVPFDQAKGSYAEWWKNFVCYCTVGPVITFFLWLTLAVAGAGNIAANDSGFSSASPAEIDTNASGGLTSIFEWENLTSFVIGMAMLVAGMDAAAKVCNGVKGPGFNKMLAATKGGGFINQFAGAKARKYGEKGVRAAGGKTVDIAGGTGVALLAATMGGQGAAAFGLGKKGQAARAEGQRVAAGNAYVPTFISDKLHKSADERQKDLADRRKKGVEETYKDASPERVVARMKDIARDKGSLGDADLGLLAEALTNPKMREKLEEEKMSDGTSVLENLVKNQLENLKTQLKGSKDLEKVEEFEKSRPDVVSDTKKEVKDPVTGAVSIVVTKPIEKIDADNVLDLDPSAYRSEEVRTQLETIMTDIVKETNTVGGVTTYTYYNELEAAQEGKRGQKKYKASMQNADGSMQPPVAGIPGRPASRGVPARAAVPPKAHGRPARGSGKPRNSSAVIRLNAAGNPI